MIRWYQIQSWWWRKTIPLRLRLGLPDPRLPRLLPWWKDYPTRLKWWFVKKLVKQDKPITEEYPWEYNWKALKNPPVPRPTAKPDRTGSSS